MKFALVLILTFCAFAVKASDLAAYDELSVHDKLSVHDELSVNDQIALPMDYELELYGNFGLVEKLRELIEKIIKKAIEASDKISQQIEKIITIATEKIQIIINRANELIKRILQAILDKINEAAAASESAKRCADTATVELQQIAQKAQDGLQVCGNNAIAKIQAIRQDLDEQIVAIQENIELLGDIVVTCLEQNGNPIAAISCVTKQSNEIYGKIVNILSNIKNGLETATKRSVEIAQEANQCVQKTVVQVQQEAFSVAKKFRDCLKETKSQTFLLN